MEQFTIYTVGKGMANGPQQGITFWVSFCSTSKSKTNPPSYSNSLDLDQDLKYENPVKNKSWFPNC